MNALGSVRARRVAATIAVVVAAACGGDDEGDGSAQTGAGAAGSGGSTGSDGVGGGGGAGPTGSASCDKPTLLVCDEYQNASAALRTALEGSCEEFGGTFADPAACPMTGFVGKCTLPESPDGSQQISRYYEGTDVDAQESSCTTIQGGTWETAF